MEYPLLSVTDLREELAQIHRGRHRTRTTALYGQTAAGSGTEIEINLAGDHCTFDVKAVRCELELRRALANKPAGHELLLLLDYDADRLAADIQGRLAAGKVYAVDRSRRLGRLFSAQSVSAQVLACRPLCELLLSDPRPFEALGFQGVTVDLHTAWRAALLRFGEITFGGDLTADRLLHEALLRHPGLAVGGQLGSQTAAGKELVRYLELVAGKLGPVIWQGWLDGKISSIAALAFVLDVAAPKLTADAGLRASIVARLQSLNPALTDAPKKSPGLLDEWGRLAEKLWRRLADARSLRQSILTEANGVVADEEVARAALFESEYLPLAFDLTAERLAAALRRGTKEAPSSKVIEEARGELERLAKHRRSEERTEQELVGRARMALRLLAYRLARPDLKAVASGFGSWGAAFALPEHYVREGAFVDYARERARGPLSTELDQAIAGVVGSIDQIRDADDEAFAKAYAAWLAGGKSSTEHVVPIEHGLDHYAVEFLKDEPHRRLLILLLDGMSWANAVELLEDCETAKGVAPLRFRGAKCTPMLAAVPSLTEVSRSALFAGKSIKPSEAGTGKDPERFATHAGFRRIGIESPMLFLRKDVETTSGHVSPRALELVHSPDRVVALVVNAFDDQLSGSRQVRVSSQSIKPLGPLLDAATVARRAVLLIADHGHVPAGMVSVGFAGDGARYRYLSEGEPSHPREVAVSKDAAFVKAGKAKVALLYRGSDSYGTSSAAGEHGGISLAEIVTPAILVGSDQLRGRVQTEDGEDDPELSVTPFTRPDWWELITPKPRAAKPTKKASQPKLPAVKPQKEFPFMPPAPSPAPSQAISRGAAPEAIEPKVESVWLVKLRKLDTWPDRSPGELERFRSRVAPRVAILADAKGTLSVESFAREAQILVRNVGGVVSEIQEWVNFDGYSVVEYDPSSKRVTLDMTLLNHLIGSG